MAIHRFSECEWITREMRNWREMKCADDWMAILAILLSFADSKRQPSRWFMVFIADIIAHCIRSDGNRRICFKKIKMNWLWFTHSHFFSLSLIDVSQSVCRRLRQTQMAFVRLLPGQHFSLAHPHRAYLLIRVIASLQPVKEATNNNYKCLSVLCVINQHRVAADAIKINKSALGAEIDTRHTKWKWSFIFLGKVWTCARTHSNGLWKYATYGRISLQRMWFDTHSNELAKSQRGHYAVHQWKRVVKC